MNFYVAEIYKMAKRKDILWGFVFAAALPLLFGFLLFTGSSVVSIGNSKFSAFSYSSGIFGFAKMLFFPYIMFIIYSTAILAQEIEHGTMNMLLIRASGRIKIFLSKYTALITIVALFIIISFLAGIVGYYLFVNNTEHSLYAFASPDPEQFKFELMIFVLSFFEFVFIVSFTLLLSLYFGNYKTIFLSIFAFVVFKVLENINVIKNFIPTYLGNVATYVAMATKDISVSVTRAIVLLCLYAIILVIISLTRFSRMDVVSR